MLPCKHPIERYSADTSNVGRSCRTWCKPHAHAHVRQPSSLPLLFAPGAATRKAGALPPPPLLGARARALPSAPRRRHLRTRNAPLAHRPLHRCSAGIPGRRTSPPHRGGPVAAHPWQRRHSTAQADARASAGALCPMRGVRVHSTTNRAGYPPRAGRHPALPRSPYPPNKRWRKRRSPARPGMPRTATTPTVAGLTPTSPTACPNSP